MPALLSKWRKKPVCASTRWEELRHLQAEDADGDQNGPKTLYLQLHELVLPIETAKLGENDLFSPTGCHWGSVVITCDQSQISCDLALYRTSHSLRPQWVCKQPLQEFEVFRPVHQVQISFNLNLKGSNTFSLNISVPLGDVPVFQDLESRLESARLDSQWYDVPGNSGAKVAVGFAFCERSEREDFYDARLCCPWRVTHKYIGPGQMETVQKYAIQYLTNIPANTHSERKPFPVFAYDMPVAAFYENIVLHGRDSILSPFVGGGQLFYYLQQERQFSVDKSRIYIAELMHALEGLSNHGFPGYDVRPTKVMLDSLGHVKICDFRLYGYRQDAVDTNLEYWQQSRYLTPESSVDPTPNEATAAWSIGAALFEMLYGLPPFYDEDVDTYISRIRSTRPLVIPRRPEIPSSAATLLLQLLEKNPAARLGASGLLDIRSHDFFIGVDWTDIASRERIAAFVPPVNPPWIAKQVRPEPDIWRWSWTDKDGIVHKRAFDFGKLARRLKSKREPPDWELLKPRSRRALKTVELGWAVFQCDFAATLRLLSQGVQCDFEEGDRPGYPRNPDNAQIFYDPTFAREFIPPLVYAVRGLNEAMVMLLLAHGANPNVGFHELDSADLYYSHNNEVSCGRVVHLAAGLGLMDITRRLIIAGADIYRAQPVAAHHLCAGVHRIKWHQVIQRSADAAGTTAEISD